MRINHRLPKNIFTSIFKTGNRSYTTHLQCISSRNEEHHIRFTIIVGTKISKLAVKRNRMKRMLRAYICTTPYMQSASIDLIILVKKDFSQQPIQEIASEIKNFITK